MAKVKTIQPKTAKALICKHILAGWKDERIVKAVQKALPDSKMDAKHCTKYRRLLFIEGSIGPELCAVNSKEYKTWQKENGTKPSKGSRKAKK